jgi:LysM repeat protein
VEALRRDNAIAPGHKPLAGSVLLVRARQARGAQTPEALVATASLATAPDLVRTTTRVRRGETLLAVARRSGVSAQALARWNGLRGRPATLRLAPGRQLELWTPRSTNQVARS